jgi:uncharacterized protein
MPHLILRLVTIAAMAASALLLFLILAGDGFLNLGVDTAKIQSFKIIFLSIILEALPFLLLGVLVSALLQSFVSDKLIQRVTPRHPIAGILFGTFLGLVLPLCECGMIPIVRRLIRKGLPAYIGIIYIVAGPIINPVVMGATFAAFRTNRQLAYSRFYLAFLVSVTLGLLLYSFLKRNPLKEEVRHRDEHEHTHGHMHEHKHGHHHHHLLHDHEPKGSFIKRLTDTPAHAAEFLTWANT